LVLAISGCTVPLGSRYRPPLKPPPPAPPEHFFRGCRCRPPADQGVPWRRNYKGHSIHWRPCQHHAAQTDLRMPDAIRPTRPSPASGFEASCCESLTLQTEARQQPSPEGPGWGCTARHGRCSTGSQPTRLDLVTANQCARAFQANPASRSQSQQTTGLIDRWILSQRVCRPGH
jgi:hypothetical protein